TRARRQGGAGGGVHRNLAAKRALQCALLVQASADPVPRVKDRGDPAGADRERREDAAAAVGGGSRRGHHVSPGDTRAALAAGSGGGPVPAADGEEVVPRGGPALRSSAEQVEA